MVGKYCYIVDVKTEERFSPKSKMIADHSLVPYLVKGLNKDGSLILFKKIGDYAEVREDFDINKRVTQKLVFL